MIPVANWDRILRLERAMRAGPAKNILELFRTAGLDPRRDFRGGDWRFICFDGLDLRGLDFSNARLFRARFVMSDVTGANFIGSDVEVTNLHRATGWRSAMLDEDQQAILELKHLRQHPDELGEESLKSLRRVKPLEEPEWVRLIKAAKSFQIAEQIYDLMAVLGQNYARSKYALTTLLDKAENKRQARQILDRFDTLEVPIDSYVVNTAISKASDESEARAWFQKYKTQFAPDIYTYSALLGKIDTFESAQGILDEMRENGFTPSNVSLNPFLWKAATFEDALEIYKQVKRPRTPDMNALLYHVQDAHWSPGGAVERLFAEGPPPDAGTFNILVHQSGALERAWEIVARMKEAGFRPDKFTLFNLLSRFGQGDVDDAVAVIARMCREGVDVQHWDTVRFLLRTLSDTVGKGHRIMLEMEAQAAPWGEVLIALASEFADASLAAELEQALATASI